MHFTPRRHPSDASRGGPADSVAVAVGGTAAIPSACVGRGSTVSSSSSASGAAGASPSKRRRTRTSLAAPLLPTSGGAAAAAAPLNPASAVARLRPALGISPLLGAAAACSALAGALLLLVAHCAPAAHPIPQLPLQHDAGGWGNATQPAPTLPARRLLLATHNLLAWCALYVALWLHNCEARCSSRALALSVWGPSSPAGTGHRSVSSALLPSDSRPIVPLLSRPRTQVSYRHRRAYLTTRGRGGWGRVPEVEETTHTKPANARPHRPCVVHYWP
jgi:hypothetical protein